MYKALLHKIYTSQAKLFIANVTNPLGQIEKPSALEQETILEHRNWSYYRTQRRFPELALLYREYTNPQDIKDLYIYEVSSGFYPIKKDGIFILADTASKFYNVINGYRFTADQPDTYQYNIYIFGFCLAVSCFAEDKFTLASHLQGKFNQMQPNTARVLNPANWKFLEDSTRQILSQRYQFQKNDIIVILGSITESTFTEALKDFNDQNFFHYHDFSNAFQRPHNYGEIFFDHIHINRNGYKMLAEAMYPVLADFAKEERQNELPYEIKRYVNSLNAMTNKQKQNAKVIGSIVMNGNPFTNGHKYLVEEALKRCDFLYVFILEEDKSYFPFSQRFAMAKLALKDLPNLVVVPSGKAILSSETMPEYFQKETLENIKIDASYDIHIFATLIAPNLGIQKRFTGHEPICQITNQYNATMRVILPHHGIEYVEIKRKTVGEQVISASVVREAIKHNAKEIVKQLVPESTLQFLISQKYLQ